MKRLFDELRLAESPSDRVLYERGLGIVASGGPGPADILWDADEVLWDWAVPFGRLLTVSPKVIVGNYGHPEWIALRPGMIGLLAGLHDGAVLAGRDPWMRLWTAGYPWRLWQIFQKIPAFLHLLGPGPSGGLACSSAELADHPRLVARGDLIRVILGLLDENTEPEILARLPSAIRPIVETQVIENPGHGGFKIPEIAVVAGKADVGTTRVLVDDTRANIDWFVASGRSGIWVKSPTPHVLFGRVPNSLWLHPDRWLRRVDQTMVPAMAMALESLTSDSQVVTAEPVTAENPFPIEAFPRPALSPLVFRLDIPNRVFWSEWFGPMKNVKKAVKARRKRDAARRGTND